MYETGLKCLNCGKEYELLRMFEGCINCKETDFSANLVVEYDYGKIRKNLDRDTLEKRRRLGIWKYEELLPINSREMKRSLGEGETPLLECSDLAKELDIKKLFLKDESRNPTHAHKARLASVGATVATRFGSKYVVAAGGNTAAAAAAYGAKYDLKTISFELKNESEQTILQTQACGGRIVYLKRFEDRYDLMKNCVDRLKAHPFSSYTPSPAGDPYGQEGYKTIGYEICQQLKWKVPDRVIVPTGQGFGLYGIWKGFVDFYELGLIDSLPKMVAAESAACGSLTKTILSKSKEIKEVVPGETVARHVVAPKVSYKAYRAIKDSDGTATMVKDDEIMGALMLVARKEGIYPGTTSGTALAAAKNLRDKGKINRGETVVCVITAGGLKDSDHVAKIFPKPLEPVEGDWEAFRDFMKNQYNLPL